RSLKRIRNDMAAYPEMVAGTKRLDTDLMKAYGGRIGAKGGAEGVHCFGDSKTGIGVALKIADGNARGTPVASMEVLKQLHIGDESIWNELFDYHYPPILNMRDERIGEIRSTLHCIDCKISINNPERRDRLAHRSGFKLLGRQSITPSCFNSLYIPDSSTVFVRCLA